MVGNYKDGDIVIDTTYRQIFIFNTKIDGWIAKNKPKQLRLATKRESQKIIAKKVNFIYY
jgi:hypothetical protein